MHLYSFILLFLLSYSYPKDLRIRGLPADEYETYINGIICDDNKKNSFVQINDDYCDCEDGKDEPGTSACYNGKFYCLNEHHFSKFIPSSKVDDSICDCCDGSDEQSNVCPNICKQQNEIFLKEQENLKTLLEEGSKKKQEYIEYGRVFKENILKEIETLGKEIEKIKREIDVLEGQKEYAEQQILAGGSNDLLFKRLRETKSILLDWQEKFAHFQDQIENLRMLDDPSFSMLEEDKKSGNADLTGVDLVVSQVKEELKSLLVSWENLNISDFYEISLLSDEKITPLPKNSPEYESNQDDDFATSIRENIRNYYYKCGAPLISSVYNLLLGKPQNSSSLENYYDLKQQSIESIGKLKQKLSDLDTKRNDLKNKSSSNYGVKMEFAKFESICLNYNTSEYIYEICPFRHANQKNLEGVLIAHLGNWKPWSDSENDYKTMLFSEGAHCWQGPQRSLKVVLTCGSDDIILSVKEPSKCEYVMEMKSPAACD